MNDIIFNNRQIKISPRKLLPLSRLLANKTLAQALTILEIMPDKKAFILKKFLKHILAIAEQKNLNKENLKIKSIQVQQGPRLKRFMPVARGRLTKITKKMSHLRLTLNGEG